MLGAAVSCVFGLFECQIWSLFACKRPRPKFEWKLISRGECREIHPNGYIGFFRILGSWRAAKPRILPRLVGNRTLPNRVARRQSIRNGISAACRRRRAKPVALLVRSIWHDSIQEPTTSAATIVASLRWKRRSASGLSKTRVWGEILRGAHWGAHGGRTAVRDHENRYTIAAARVRYGR